MTVSQVTREGASSSTGSRVGEAAGRGQHTSGTPSDIEAEGGRADDVSSPPYAELRAEASVSSLMAREQAVSTSSEGLSVSSEAISVHEDENVARAANIHPTMPSPAADESGDPNPKPDPDSNSNPHRQPMRAVTEAYTLVLILTSCLTLIRSPMLILTLILTLTQSSPRLHHLARPLQATRRSAEPQRTPTAAYGLWRRRIRARERHCICEAACLRRLRERRRPSRATTGRCPSRRPSRPSLWAYRHPSTRPAGRSTRTRRSASVWPRMRAQRRRAERRQRRARRARTCCGYSRQSTPNPALSEALDPSSRSACCRVVRRGECIANGSPNMQAATHEWSTAAVPGCTCRGAHALVCFYLCIYVSFSYGGTNYQYHGKSQKSFL